MQVSVILLIKNNQVIEILQEDSDLISFIENELDLNTKHMEREDMFEKISNYVDGLQVTEINIKEDQSLL